MTRQGAAKKVISSGRLTGPAKIQNGKKRAAIRKASAASVDSGYSLYSTDSEDQVTTIHKGLDRCAALLKDILQSEGAGVKTLTQKPGKAAVPKTKAKVTVGKGDGLKKKEPRKKIPTAHVQKETAERKITPGAGQQAGSSNASQSQNIQAIQIPYSQHSPPTHLAPSEHVQTQMSLMDTHAQVYDGTGSSAQPCYTALDPGQQGATLFNYRLPTSTPTLSPQRLANPLIIQNSASTNLYNQQAPQIGEVGVPPFHSVPAPGIPSSHPIGTASTVVTCTPSAASSNTVVPTSAQPSYGGGANAKLSREQQLKEKQFLLCIQQHLAQLRHSEPDGQQVNFQALRQVPGQVESSEESSAPERSDAAVSEEEEDDLQLLDLTPVKDTSCQTSFDVKKRSPNKTVQKVKTVKYLLGELKALVVDQDDTEVLRLISELEESVSLLPAMIGSTNVQAELALAVQPLRSENAQLRRRLRILNQQLRERERAEKDSRSGDNNFELLSLQSMNMMLQTQVKESEKGLEQLRKKDEELLQVMDGQKEENKRLLKLIQEKEQELVQGRQQCEMDTVRVRKEVDDALVKMKTFQFRLESSEKENQILGITLRQRDAEVNRLRELTRTLQNSMAKLLSDLRVDSVRGKTEYSLTKSLLEAYESPLQHDPALDRSNGLIANYLKKLEKEPLLTNGDVGSSIKTRGIEAPNALYNHNTTSGDPAEPYQSNLLFSEKRSSPMVWRNLSRQSIETESDSCTLGEGHKLDETTYIPLSNDTPGTRKHRAAIQSSKASKKLDCGNGISDSQQFNGYTNGSLPLGRLEDVEEILSGKLPASPSLQEKNPMENSSPARTRAPVPEGDQIQMRTVHRTSNLHLDFADQEMGLPPLAEHLETSATHPKTGVHLPRERISVVDSSFSNFDCGSMQSDWSTSSVSTFRSCDEQDFRNGLAALDADIARLQRTLHSDLLKR
ncbi:coiled-coil domain-containing protein 14 [Latimeria chalumnae]|uniref:coiled-coil domain-containing protein 14 n=1 Tax=Latimeria chalumnae TaxID=7897 RepID=UPI0006D908DC|nr:PREDICTED: coiled-coil domain-containing protein 14 [Latimeria chalumnae]|eukprot:XP_014344921.1 PREDICTED: coiled-coil domain-containing protein 14 [Latimeria chalumnae]